MLQKFDIVQLTVFLFSSELFLLCKPFNCRCHFSLVAYDDDCPAVTVGRVARDIAEDVADGDVDVTDEENGDEVDNWEPSSDEEEEYTQSIAANMAHNKRYSVLPFGILHSWSVWKESLSMEPITHRI